ncbi:hypothetical protein KP79_PYT08914 [Mizuhopecten yessoensis]|uniref:Uncharacterized protein n=1 Tax=Mizuhopecten yessoensis TaxID=6573 RepID=A0A210R3Z9_MIZYE|nr:hypothetical protein KP79_PYT08914 [Mizuhopecten yessoensis]
MSSQGLTTTTPRGHPQDGDHQARLKQLHKVITRTETNGKDKNNLTKQSQGRRPQGQTSTTPRGHHKDGDHQVRLKQLHKGITRTETNGKDNNNLTKPSP